MPKSSTEFTPEDLAECPPTNPFLESIELEPEEFRELKAAWDRMQKSGTAQPRHPDYPEAKAAYVALALRHVRAHARNADA